MNKSAFRIYEPIITYFSAYSRTHGHWSGFLSAKQYVGIKKQSMEFPLSYLKKKYMKKIKFVKVWTAPKVLKACKRNSYFLKYFRPYCANNLDKEKKIDWAV